MNLYRVVYNNPLFFIDDNGKSSVALVLEILVVDIVTSEPTDAAILIKVGIYAFAIIGAIVVDKLMDDDTDTETDSFPKVEPIPIPKTEPRKKSKGCFPCNPPVGTPMYLGPHSSHFHGGIYPHYHYFTVNQSPYPICKCYTNKTGFGSEPIGIPVVFYPTGGGLIP